MRQYTGARYMPKFMGNYDPTQEYEALSVVDNGLGTSYICGKPTPAGTPLTNLIYWHVYGSTSGAIINLQNQIDALRVITDESILYIDSFLNVKDFGAVGDSTTDDTQAIKDAIAEMQSTRKPLFFPEGDYRITEMITVDCADSTFFKIFGASDRMSIIRSDFSNDGTNTATFKLYRSSGTSTFHDIEISNLLFIDANASHNVDAFDIKYVNRMIVENVLFRQFRTGFYASMSWCVKLDNVRFTEFGGNVSGRPYIVLGSQCNDWNITNCAFSMALAHNAGVYSNPNVVINAESANIKFDACVFEYGRGVSITNSNVSVPVRNIILIGCYFEHMTLECVYAERLVSGLTVISCYCNMSTDGNAIRTYAFRTANTVKDVSYINCSAVYYNSLIDLNSGYAESFNIINCCGDGSVPIFSGGVLSNHAKVASSEPSSGDHQRGEFVWNNIPTGTAPTIGWVCTVSGTPGTWVALNAN